MSPVGAARVSRNSQLGAVIPDSGLLHNYDARELSSATTFTDQAGSADLSAVGSPSLNASGINGNQTVSLDGVNDYYEKALSETQPLDVFIVGQKVEAGDGGVYSTDQTGAHPRFTYTDADGFQLDAGTQISSNAESTAAEIFLTTVDGSNSAIYISDQNTAAVSGDAGGDGFGGTFYLGVNGADSFHLESEFGQILFYDTTASGYNRSDVWSYLSGEWGIAV